MKRPILILIFFLILIVEVASGATLKVNSRNHVSEPTMRRRLTLTLAEDGPVVIGPWLMQGDAVARFTDTNGIGWFSNVPPANYFLDIAGSPGRRFPIAIPDTNGIIDASVWINSTNNQAVFYTAAQVDALIVSSGGGAGITNNQALPGIPTTTNALFAGNFSGALTGRVWITGADVPWSIAGYDGGPEQWLAFMANSNLSTGIFFKDNGNIELTGDIWTTGKIIADGAAITGTLTNNTTGTASGLDATGLASIDTRRANALRSGTNYVNLSGSNNITGLLTVKTNQSAVTNSAAVLGWGGVALSSVIYGDNSATANWRGGIHWYPPGWDTVLAAPNQQDIDTWDSAIRSVRHWGNMSLLIPTLHIATKGNLRIEPGFGSVDYYGQYYWSFGNEDANTQMRINYTTMSYKRTGTNMSDNAPYQGYGLPLRFEAVHRIGGLNAFSSPGIWGRFADTNAGYASEYSGKDAYLGELWFMARTPANDTTNGTIGIQKPDYGVLSGRMLTNGWDFRGRTMNEQIFVTVTTDTNVPLNFERAKFQTIDLNTITTNLFYTTNVIAISSFTNIYGYIQNLTNAEEKEFRIRAGALDRYLKWPTGWAVDSALPTRLTNQTQLFLRLTAWGTGETNITVSAWRILTDSAFTYDSDAQAFFTAASISDATQKGAVDYLVKARKAANIWTNAVGLYPMVGGASNTHAVNLKSPSAYPITYTSSGVTHDANGITGNGSSGYGTISTMGTMLGSQGVTNCSVIVYCKTTTPTDAGRFIGSTDGTGRFGLARNSASLGVEGPMNLNGPTSYDNLSSDFTGFLAATRDCSDANRWFTGTRNAITERSTLATAMPTGNMLVLARMASGSPANFSSANLAYAEIGYGYSSNGLYQLRTIINNFQTILGRQ